MTFRKVLITPGFILMLSVFYYFDRSGMLALSILASLIHEAGHYAAVRAFGGKIDALTLSVTGADMALSGSSLGYVSEAVCALAGPAASFIGAIVSSAAGKLTGLDEAFALSGICVIQGALNLLPSSHLDGGRAIYLLILRSRGHQTAEKLILITGLASALMISTAGLLTLLRTGYNYSLLAAGTWLFLSGLRRDPAAEPIKRTIGTSRLAGRPTA